jgi:8-oxo-dGTP pyrophosphatase MutT (NUDIX family)
MKDERGFRIVAGCICVRQSNQSQVEEILLLSSRRRSGRWVLPKGGQEKGETGEQAAMRGTKHFI